MIKKIVEESQAFYGIPFVVGVVDGSHIPIIVPKFHVATYYIAILCYVRNFHK
jgi:hypothetical protein